MELADLTRYIRKNNFLEPDVFFCKAGLVCVSSEHRRKKNMFFAADRGAGSKPAATPGSRSFEAKYSCCRKRWGGYSGWSRGFDSGQGCFHQVFGKRIFKVPESIHIWILRGLEAAQARAKKQHFFRV